MLFLFGFFFTASICLVSATCSCKWCNGSYATRKSYVGTFAILDNELIGQ